MDTKLFLTIISGVAFIVYGLLILLTGHMKEEFKRYQLEKYRILTGLLEFLGGAGSLLGLWFEPLLLLATGGLGLLMLGGFLVRLKLRDPWVELLPALILGLINWYLCCF